MAEELKDDVLDEVSGGILGVDEQKIFEEIGRAHV